MSFHQSKLLKVYVAPAAINFCGNWKRFMLEIISVSSVSCHILTQVLMHRWLRNDAHIFKWHGRGALLVFVVICHISRSHGQQIDFSQIWAFPYNNSNLNSRMAMKWHIVSRCMEEGHPYCFYELFIQILKSHGQKIRWYGSDLSKITRPVAAIKSLRFALFEYRWDFLINLSQWYFWTNTSQHDK